MDVKKLLSKLTAVCKVVVCGSLVYNKSFPAHKFSSVTCYTLLPVSHPLAVAPAVRAKKSNPFISSDAITFIVCRGTEERPHIAS